MLVFSGSTFPGAGTACLKGEKTSARAIILDILETVDVKSCLLAADLTHDDVSAIRSRLLGIGT